MMDHIPSCFQIERIPCPTGISLHGEPLDEHFWSGWPGAFCLKCGSEDKNELCLGNSCKCSCHDALWKSYEEHLKKEE